jgi:hypothetical protein
LVGTPHLVICCDEYTPSLDNIPYHRPSGCREHAIIEQEVSLPWNVLEMPLLIRQKWRTILKVIMDDEPSININPLVAAQLLKKDEALLFKTYTRSNVYDFLIDPERDVIRLYPECSLKILTIDNPLHPINQERVLYILVTP